MIDGKKAKFKSRATRACAFCKKQFDESLYKCTACGQWNIPKASHDTSGDQTVLLSEVSPTAVKRILTGPWDKCFGGPRDCDYGIVTTSVNIIGGVPGAGKSTMALQLADQLAEATEREVLYVGAEEIAEEIRYRSERLNLKHLNKIRVHPMGSNVDLREVLLGRKPSGIILDSLPGLVSDHEQAVELCKRFKDYTVELKAPCLIIDHVTKDEDFAGLMALQHAVDGLFKLDVHGRGDKDGGLRELLTIKNRFGPANVSVYMKMTETGLYLARPKIDFDDGEDDELQEALGALRSNDESTESTDESTDNAEDGEDDESNENNG